VITEGAHIAGKSDVTKKWSAVNDAFFNQNEARLFKDELHKKGDFRDKFKQTMASTKADIDTANQSGRSGDLGPQFQLVKQIMEEIEDYEEEEIERKKKEDDTKKKLNEIEAKAQSNRPNPLKKRDLDGAIIDSSDPNKKKKESFDDHLMKWMAERTASTSKVKDVVPATAVKIETITKGNLLNYVNATKTSLEMFLNEAEITDADEEQVGLLNSIGIKAIIDIYCTRRMEFSGSAFKKELKDLGVQLLIAIKLFVLLEEWRDRLATLNFITMIKYLN